MKTLYRSGLRSHLQHGQIQLSGLDQRLGLPYVDGLDPVARVDVEDVDVGVRVDQEAAVANCGSSWHSRVHDFSERILTRLGLGPN